MAPESRPELSIGTAAGVTPDAPVGHGHVDFYGYHEPSRGWVICGWISADGLAPDGEVQVRIEFDNEAFATAATAATHARDDLRDVGAGVLLHVPAPVGPDATTPPAAGAGPSAPTHLRRLTIETAEGTWMITPTQRVRVLAGDALTATSAAVIEELVASETRHHLAALLAHDPPGPPRIDSTLSDTEAASLRERSGHGHIDEYGYHAPSIGWMICGWISPDHSSLDATPQVKVVFEHGSLVGPGLLSKYRRADLSAAGIGFVLHVPASRALFGRLISLTIQTVGFSWRITPAHGMRILRDRPLATHLLEMDALLDPGAAAERMEELITRRGFTSENTFAELTDRIFLELDASIFCPPDGMGLVGWAWFDPDQVRSIRLCCANLTTELKLDACLRMDRSDVMNAHLEIDEARTGFLAFLPHSVVPGEPMYVEVETTRGEVAHHEVPRPKLAGMTAIKYILDRVDVEYGHLADAYDTVVGPMVSSLNAERLRSPQRFQVVDYGPAPAAPEVSLIVPLYGRLDFMEYQFAFLSRHHPAVAIELIYVLDDPDKRQQAAHLAASIYERFRLPFRLVLLSRNVGFAPANNVGLGLSRAEYVCFLNSDVFAGSRDWIERLVHRLRVDRDLGAVGPLLLFDDDTVQHEGMVYERLPEFSGWHFPIHARKGWRRPAERGLAKCAAITAACIMLSSATMRELGGFDEAYVIGDFEDSDLCLKLRSRGLSCAIDRDVHLYHLERQSQGGSSQRWRRNLTLYNAWVHERRWGTALQQRALPAPQASA